MTNADIIRCRLRNHQIDRPGSSTPAELVEWMGAVQGQDYAGGKWTIGSRIQGSHDRDIENAISERSIVRSWGLRGTLHFMAAKDIRWILSLIDHRLATLYRGTYLKMGLDSKILKKSKSVMSKALAGGRQVTREELMNEHRENGIATNDLRAGFLLLRAALDGHICFGERRGNQFTFALLDEWVPAESPKDHDEALAELTTRYFKSHGPATVKDFRWWSGLTIADIKRGIDIAGAALKREYVGGIEYYMDASLSPITVKPGVQLLSGFDEYIVGYADRSLVVGPDDIKMVTGTGNGLFNPTILANGKVAGTWKRTLSKGKLTVNPMPFKPFSQARTQAVASASRRFAKFLGTSLQS